MKLAVFYRKPISIFVMVMFTILLCFCANRLPAANSNSRTTDSKSQAEKSADSRSSFELSFWESIRESKDINDFKAYLVKYPKGTFVDLAKNRIKALEANLNAIQARIAEDDKKKEVEDKFAAERIRLAIEMVLIPGNYFIGKYEVTQRQWQAVMGSNPSFSNHGGNYPVDNVSWNDCQVFIKKLNERTGKHYRLPTDKEWEYACCAGNTDYRDDDVDAIAWYKNNSGVSTHPVGQKQPNAFGLYDMIGNVMEWCQNGPPEDGSRWRGPQRFARGGHYWSKSRMILWDCENGFYTSDFIHSGFGFRLASDSIAE